MAISFKKFWQGIRLVPKVTSTIDSLGELEALSSTNKVNLHNGTSVSPIVTESHAATLTNKALTSPVINTGVSGSAIDTDVTLAANSDTLLASQKAVKAYIDSSAGSVQADVNDLVTLTGVPANSTNLGTFTGMIIPDNSDIKDALQSLETEADAMLLDVGDLITLSGVPANSPDLGTFTGTTIPDASDNKEALQALETAIEAHIADATDAHDASAISVVPSGNLAATDVQSALVELQGDADTAATHIAASTNVHGLSGGAAVVGTTSAQTLTNKTITGADFRTPVRSDVKQDTLSNLTTYASTATNGQLVFATDSKAMYQVVDNALVSVGSGGGAGNIDALLIQTFDSAILADFTQTGLALVTNNVINGAASARLIHQPASSQSFKQIKAVDRKYRGELMQMSLEVRSSASEGNLTLRVTDETNAATIMASSPISTGQIQVATAVTTNASATVTGFSNSDINKLSVGMTITGAGIQTGTVINSINSVAGSIVMSQNATASATITAKISALPTRRSFSFTLPANCASFSYTVTALQEAGSPESYVDDIVIELAATALLSTSVSTPTITAWQGYTPTFQGFGTPSAIEFEWRQVGESVEIRGKFTSGTTTAVEARIGLPAGLSSAGTAIIPSLSLAGNLMRGTATANAQKRSVVLVEPTVNYVTFGSDDYTNSVSPFSKRDGNAILGNGELASLIVSVPCSGLSATTSTSIPLTQSGVIQEADSIVRLNTFNAYGSTATKIPRFSNLTQSVGSNILYQDSVTNGASFTVLESGEYSFVFSFAANTTHAVGITKNSASLTTNIGSITGDEVLAKTTAVAGNAGTTVTWSGRLNAGDIVRPHTDGVASSGGNQLGAVFSAARQGSLKQVTVNPNSKITIPTSELRFEGASTRGSTATAIVRFDTMAKIRGDAFSIVSDAVNGTAITMLKAGKLTVTGSLFTGAAYAYLTRNKSVLTTAAGTTSEQLAASGSGSAGFYATIDWDGDVAVGDVLRVSSGANPTVDAINNITLSFQEQDIQVGITNILPQFSESDSSVRVDTANGFGSVGTRIRRFSNVRENIGTDVEYADNASNGASFTAKSDGIYQISYTDAFPSAGYLGISKNASSLTVEVQNLAISQVVAMNYVTTATASSNVAWSGYLVAGDIIRPHTNTVATTANQNSFTMSKVGKPNVTGVNVTPFVNVPQPDSQSYVASLTVGMVPLSVLQNTNNGLFSISTVSGRLRVTALKSITVSMYGSITASAAGAGAEARTFLNGTLLDANYTIDRTGTTYLAGSNSSVNAKLSAGEHVEFLGQISVGTFSQAGVTVTATALSDQILTAPETFSTDTNSLTYAGSAQYTLATLPNAPIGTYLTFVHTINTVNTKTQTTTRPTQTDADMNTSGILLNTRVYGAAGSAATPSYFAIQIGKGLQGLRTVGFQSAGKTGEKISLSPWSIDANTQYGCILAPNESYDPITGILTLDAATTTSSTITTHAFWRDSGNNSTSAYVVINASKNPALTGMNLNRVAARGVSTSGQSIPNVTNTTIVYDAAKTFDTNGALNSATGVFTSPETGYYQVNALVSFASTTGVATLSLNLRKNGIVIATNSNIPPATTTTYTVPLSDLVFLGKGDTLDMFAVQNTGGTRNLTTNAGQNYLSISKVSV